MINISLLISYVFFLSVFGRYRNNWAKEHICKYLYRILHFYEALYYEMSLNIMRAIILIYHVDAPYIFYPYSTVDALGCFQLIVILTNAMANIFMNSNSSHISSG